jgi:cytochrome bd-type quinol oxidase subunit 2
MMTILGLLLAQQYGSVPLDTLANVGAPAYVGVPGSSAQTNLGVTVARILNTVFGLLGIVFVVLIIYGGFLWMTSAGNESQVEKARKIMTQAVIGLAIVLMSYAIAKFVTEALYKATSSSVI